MRSQALIRVLFKTPSDILNDVHASEFRTETRHGAWRFAMTMIWPSAPEQKSAQIHQGVVAQVLSTVAPPDSAVYLPLTKVLSKRRDGGRAL